MSSSSVRYLSTRGSKNDESVTFRHVVMRGLASDGGLYIPNQIPTINSSILEQWSKLTFGDLAVEIISLFIDVKADNLPHEKLKEIVKKSFANFDTPSITPLKTFPSQHSMAILELFHGPTFAFKDIALQFLGNLFEYFLATDQRASPITVLGATSGDTGSAAIYGLRGKKRVDVYILFPNGKVAPVQEKQMTTVQDPNIHCVSVDGTFDDCQDIVKELFNDQDFRDKHNLAAINSINWARILAQIVYYFYAYFQWRSKFPANTAKLSFSVPTGNFGDVLAGYYAKRMGLPIHKLIVATNSNDILHRFFTSGDYSRKEVAETFAPSMDIQISSNFERYLYYLAGENSDTVNAWMLQLKNEGKMDVPKELVDVAKKEFCSFAISQEQILEGIREVYEKHHYILCPHSVIGFIASQHFMLKYAGTAVITLATAHPAKFPDVVHKAINLYPEIPLGLKSVLNKPSKCLHSAPTAAAVSHLLSEGLKSKFLLVPATSELFAKYCNITDENLIRDIAEETQTEALKVFPYKCIQEFRFITPRVRQHPRYQDFVKNIENKTVLDIGCCMGTDVRQMIVDGFSPQNVYGVDIAEGFFDLGYKLYKDESRLPRSHFIKCDITNEEERAKLQSTVEGGGFDFLYAGSVLHLLDKDMIESLLKAAFALASPKNGTFFGRNVGVKTTPGVFAPVSTVDRFSEKYQLRYLHTVESLRQALLDAGFKSATVEMAFNDMSGEREWNDDRCFLAFSATA